MGGDLNLKKSWHPNTTKNQERLWKAEQTKSVEEKKLKVLRKEIEDERNREELRRFGENSGVLNKSDGDKKLDWMYKNTNELINRDEYLLGRKIDKSFEILQAEEEEKQKNIVGNLLKKSINPVEHECIPFSIRSYRGVDTSEQVDLQRKVMEDPLMLIKQKEMESRRKLLENPVKLKELHRILKTDQILTKNIKKSKKSKKKHKKRTKSSDLSASETDSDDNLDRKLEKQYKKLKGNQNDLSNLSLMKLLESKYDTISKELDRAAGTKKKKQKKNSKRFSDTDDSDDLSKKKNEQTRERVNRERHSRSRSRSHSIPFNRQQNINPGTSDINHQQHFSSRNSDRRDNNQRTNKEFNRFDNYKSNRRSPNYREIRSKSKERTSRTSRNQLKDYSSSRQHDKYKRSRSRENQRKAERQYSRSRSPVKSKDKWKTQHSPKNSPKKVETSKTTTANKKLNEEEKQARLREMMSNAAWREDDRSKAVKKQREAYEREEQQNKAREFDTEFLNKQVKKAIANQTSVGSRIRSNLNNIQRSSTAMNSNFARK